MFQNFIQDFNTLTEARTINRVTLPTIPQYLANKYLSGIPVEDSPPAFKMVFTYGGDPKNTSIYTALMKNNHIFNILYYWYEIAVNIQFKNGIRVHHKPYNAFLSDKTTTQNLALAMNLNAKSENIFQEFLDTYQLGKEEQTRLVEIVNETYQNFITECIRPHRSLVSTTCVTMDDVKWVAIFSHLYQAMCIEKIIHAMNHKSISYD